MSITKTLSLQTVAILSTQYNRRNLLSMECGFALPGDYSNSDLMIAPASNRGISPITTIILLATDSPNITVNITNGLNTVTIPLQQMMILSGPIANLVITNNDLDLADNPARIRAIWS